MIGYGHYDKREIWPLQAADMLAWYTNQEFTRYKANRTERRKDFSALLRSAPIDMRMDHNRESLEAFKGVLDRHGGSVLAMG